LEREHDGLVERLKKAQESLADKLEEKANYITGLAGNFGGTLDIETDGDNRTTLGSALKQLRERVAKTKELKRVTDQLSALGLDKGLLKQIVESGAVDFAASIIAGGTEAVKELNAFAKEADAEALALAERVGGLLFDEGIEFAKGLVKEFTDSKAAIELEMAMVAKAFGTELETAIKGGLGLLTDQTMTVAVEYIETNKPTKPVTTKPAAVGGGGGSATPWQFMATGGFVNGPTPAIIGEAGPEVVYPLKDFERVMGLDGEGRGNTVNYYAAPNNSIDSEQALLLAMKRAKVVGAW
jgi:hypothetical protein